MTTPCHYCGDPAVGTAEDDNGYVRPVCRNCR